ncbi:hypothetical protein NUU61_001606 [Penicillium alfredii]|uniref:Uncharacterized protein n=1 Tax=Penicillium alfredii TaxID=1506179 RepID=A0A9W9G1D6_9EURO|nr:uncharacterized protein NUU61_001606 [Penicillium alfredii]KAJ5110349.1 hypothetical protein NUU61_001606 [Penicillium alfredii]
MRRLLRVFGHTPRLPPSKMEASITEARGNVADRAVDSHRQLRVVVIGAGISGILACVRLAQRIPNLELCVYEKNEDVGGTWFENRYPGCACGRNLCPCRRLREGSTDRALNKDIPAHTYQATFEPNPEWTTNYALASEIHRYWKYLAHKYGCMKYIKLKHQVCEAVWDDTKFKWQLQIQDRDSGTTYPDQCEVLIQATGLLNHWKWPAIPGLHEFQGKLMHSASWDESYDYMGQRVAIIGNGSSGIQIVPAMLPNVAHIDHYIRNPTWIAPSFAKAYLDGRGQAPENFAFPEDERKTLREDPPKYLAMRKGLELVLQSVHGATLLGHRQQIAAQQEFTRHMDHCLTDRPDLSDELTPSFPPACRRLTPGPGYLQALKNEKVKTIKSAIVGVDTTGIITADGLHRPIDVLVCATGFDTSYSPRFPVIGRGGISLAERWKNTPETYLSIAIDGFPNLFHCLGPNSGLGEGNLLLVIERIADYFTECVRKIQRENIMAMTPRDDAVRRFTQYCDQYFSGTVYSGECRSWYKSGTEDGRVTALWPGSSLHAKEVFTHPRWEDFTYDHGGNNPMGWLGDGWTEDEKRGTIRVDYLDDDKIDFPPVPLEGS